MKELENLVKISKLKTEPADVKEFNGMVLAGDTKLKDSQINAAKACG